MMEICGPYTVSQPYFPKWLVMKPVVRCIYEFTVNEHCRLREIHANSSMVRYEERKSPMHMHNIYIYLYIYTYITYLYIIYVNLIYIIYDLYIVYSHASRKNYPSRSNKTIQCHVVLPLGRPPWRLNEEHCETGRSSSFIRITRWEGGEGNTGGPTKTKIGVTCKYNICINIYIYTLKQMHV